MSKLGKKPIVIPKDTKIKLESGRLVLTGPKGSKELSINDKIFSTTITDDNNLVLKLLKKNESLNKIWASATEKMYKDTASQEPQPSPDNDKKTDNPDIEDADFEVVDEKKDK